MANSFFFTVFSWVRMLNSDAWKWKIIAVKSVKIYLLLKLCKLVLVLWNLLQRWLDAEGTMHLFLTKIFWSRLLAKKINYPTWKNITADTSTSNVYNNTRRSLEMQNAAILTIFHEGHLQRYSAHLSEDEVIRKAQ